jgi:Right handed beta helix region
MTFILRALTSFCLIAASAVAAASDVTFFISPNGSDSAEGQTQQKPLISLQLAMDRAIKSADSSTERIVVNVAEGTYTAQRVSTEGHPKGIKVIIKPTHPDERMPVFDGGGEGGAWFSLRSEVGKATRISIMGLRITRYATAISLNGSRDSTGAFNSGNVIEGNVFETIGQIANPKGPKSTAAIRLINSRENEIRKNRFSNIKNIEGCSALHSIYMAHYSSKNIIEGNTFENVCGQTIKVRDQSNNNIVRNNIFKEQATTTTFQEAFCNKDERGDECTKEGGECPSVGNVYESNTVSTKGSSKKLTAIRVQEGDVPSSCPTKNVRSADRVTEKGTRIVQ